MMAEYTQSDITQEENTQCTLTQEILVMDGQIPLTDFFWQTERVRIFNKHLYTIFILLANICLYFPD